MGSVDEAAALQDFMVGLKWLKIARFGSPTETLIEI